MQPASSLVQSYLVSQALGAGHAKQASTQTLEPVFWKGKPLWGAQSCPGFGSLLGTHPQPGQQPQESVPITGTPSGSVSPLIEASFWGPSSSLYKQTLAFWVSFRLMTGVEVCAGTQEARPVW